MPFISWKLVESRSKDSTERVLVVILISADQPFDKFASKKIYIYVCREEKKDAVIHARISSSSFWLDVAAVFAARVAVCMAR